MSSDGLERTLVFPVRLSVEGTRRFERVGYFPPQLEWFVRTPRISHVTGLESIDTTKRTQEATWQEARRILLELSPLIPQLQGQYSYVFPMMVELAANDGALGESA